MAQAGGGAEKESSAEEAYRALAEVEVSLKSLAPHVSYWVKRKRKTVYVLPRRVSGDWQAILRALEDFDRAVSAGMPAVYAYVGRAAAETGSEEAERALTELSRRVREHGRALAALRAALQGQAGRQEDVAFVARAAIKKALDLAVYIRHALDVAARASRRAGRAQQVREEQQEPEPEEPRVGGGRRAAGGAPRRLL